MRNGQIDYGREFDWGRASLDYARYRDIYPERFFQEIRSLGLCVRGQQVLDLGTGTGVLPRHLSRYGAHFTGADISENQIEQARRLSEEAGLSIDYVVSPAEELDFPDASFDVVTACQCFMYFDKNKIFRKVHRFLKNDGHLCILFMAWLPEESKIAKGSEELVLKYNPQWTGANWRRYVPQMPGEAEGLFAVENAYGFDLSVAFTREAWNGRIRACRGIGASSLSREEIACFEREHLAFLSEMPETFEIPHHATVLNLRRIPVMDCGAGKTTGQIPEGTERSGT